MCWEDLDGLHVVALGLKSGTALTLRITLVRSRLTSLTGNSFHFGSTSKLHISIISRFKKSKMFLPRLDFESRRRPVG